MGNTSSRIGIEALSKRSGVSSDKLNAAFETIVTLLEEGRSITIPRFGKFEPRFTDPRPITSPIIPEGTQVKRRRKIKFAMSEYLREKWVLEAKEGA